jgi:hypothetical protein
MSFTTDEVLEEFASAAHLGRERFGDGCTKVYRSAPYDLEELTPVIPTGVPFTRRPVRASWYERTKQDPVRWAAHQLRQRAYRDTQLARKVYRNPRKRIGGLKGWEKRKAQLAAAVTTGAP